MKTVKLVRVFVASPSDLMAEREMVSAAADEVNDMMRREGVRVEVIRAERDVVPDVGNRAQEVVLEQVGDDYEIFLGIMGGRFGSPTGTGGKGSGTEEEFEEALKRRRGGGGGPRIMFYFKTGVGSLTEIDPDQLKKVIEFKKRAHELGVFHGEFKEAGGFKDLVRVHLVQAVLKEMGVHEAGIGKVSPPVGVDEKGPTEIGMEVSEWAIDEDEGFVDLVAEAEEAMAAAREVTERIGKSMTEMTEDLGIRTSELQEEIRKTPHANVGRIRGIMARSAVVIESFGKSVRSERPMFRRSWENAVRCYGKAMVMGRGAGVREESYEELRGSVRKLRGAMEYASGGMQELRKQMVELPRLSRDVNKATRFSATEIDGLVDDIEAGIQLVRELERLI